MDDAFSLHLKWFRHCLSNSESLKISNKISRILHTKGRRRDFVPGQPDRTKPTRETIMKSWIGLAAIAGTHAGCKYWKEFHFRWSQIQHYWDRDGTPNSFLNSVMFHHLKWESLNQFPKIKGLHKLMCLSLWRQFSCEIAPKKKVVFSSYEWWLAQTLLRFMIQKRFTIVKSHLGFHVKDFIEKFLWNYGLMISHKVI